MPFGTDLKSFFTVSRSMKHNPSSPISRFTFPTSNIHDDFFLFDNYFEHSKFGGVKEKSTSTSALSNKILSPIQYLPFSSIVLCIIFDKMAQFRIGWLIKVLGFAVCS